MASHLISHTLYKVEQMKTSRAHFVVHIGQKPILNDLSFFVVAVNYKKQMQHCTIDESIKGAASLNLA